ncbi:hypothetical protein NHQ30_010640 [Ciborinia camelliae]|nr:hypothetical protein NHQ30_010640 [Ciborinia camelliae]
MHFSISLLVAALFTFASASPAPAPAPAPEPTTPTASQTQALIDDLQSYFAALPTQSAMLSLVSSLATDTAALNTLEAFQQSLQSDILAGKTPNTAVLTALPSPLATVIASIYEAEMSIISQDGFGDLVASATATATATHKTSATGSGSGSGSATAGTASATSSTVGNGAAGALGVDRLRITAGLAVGVAGVVVLAL